MITPRSSVIQLKPYNAVQIHAEYILNANETENYLYPNGFHLQANLALYPEAQAETLRKELSNKFHLQKEQVITGNGSTQLLELVIRTYCEKEDKILTFAPTFSMYEIYAKAQDISYLSIPLRKNMTLDVKEFIDTANKNQVKLIILCNPNNPTGTLFKKDTIKQIIDQTDALVIVDEAYMEFASEEYSMIDLIDEYDRLIVARTFSKAYGLASIRLGYLLSNANIIQALLKMSLPYNVNTFTQTIGLDALSKESQMISYVRQISFERDRVATDILNLGIEVYPSATNFLYIYSELDLFQIFINQNVLIRSFQNNFYRITIQNKETNDTVIRILKEAQK